MKNLTINSTIRHLFSLAIIMVGLWIPHGWAATIHSVAAGGDWNKAETWVGGQVPGADDSVVNGTVSVYGKTVAGLTVSSGAILENRSGSTLTVNGNITNNGIIKNADEGGTLYIRVSGDITNNGQWNNYKTTFFGNVTATINGKVPASRIYFEKDLSVTSKKSLNC